MFAFICFIIKLFHWVSWGIFRCVGCTCLLHFTHCFSSTVSVNFFVFLVFGSFCTAHTKIGKKRLLGQAVEILVLGERLVCATFKYGRPYPLRYSNKTHTHSKKCVENGKCCTLAKVYLNSRNSSNSCNAFECKYKRLANNCEQGMPGQTLKFI